MKITREVERVVVEQEVDDIICNKCGKSCKDHAGMNFEGLLEVSIQGGYASFLGDDAPHTFSLCERCLDEMFRTFVIPPSASASIARRSDMMDYVVELLHGRDMSVEQLRARLVAEDVMDEDAFVAAMASLEEGGFIGPVGS
jgi:hypothetical protein